MYLDLLPLAIPLTAGLAAGWWLRGAHAPGGGDRHKGMASRPEINAGMSARAVRRSTRYTRPSLADVKRPPIEECGILLGFRPGVGRVPIYSKLEDCVLISGPPRQGKTLSLKGNLIQFPGAAVVTSTKLDIVKDTASRRKRNRGPYAIFNPERLGDKASTFRWNPVEGCKDARTAIDRAGYLLAGTAAGGGAGDREFWTNNANKVLRAYLFAAAHADASLMTVKRWANNPNDRTAVELLMTIDNAPHGWADELSQVLDSYDRFRESVFATLAQTFDFLGTPGVQEVVELAEGEQSFDVARFLRSKATLYLIGAHKDYGSIAPLFSALTGMIYECGKQLAQASPGGRLDPPLLFALDEAPNICPVPLHRWTSEAGSQGMPIITCIQSRKHLDDVWGDTRGAIIWENSTAKMWLPAGSDADTLEKVSKLCGTYLVPKVTETTAADGSRSRSTVMETRRVLEPHEVRMLDDRTAVVVIGNRKPVIVKLEPYWERRSVQRSEAKAPAVVPLRHPPSPRTPAPESSAEVAVITSLDKARGKRASGD